MAVDILSRSREDQVAIGRPDRGARRDRHRAGRRRRDRGPEVRVRPLGRHREPREQARDERGPRPLPCLGVDGRRAGRSIRLRAPRDPRGEGQGPHDRPRPAGPPRGRPRHGAARLRASNDRDEDDRPNAPSWWWRCTVASGVYRLRCGAGAAPVNRRHRRDRRRRVRRLRREPDRRRDVCAGPGARRLHRRATAGPAVSRGLAERPGGGRHRREAGVPVVAAAVPRPERGSVRQMPPTSPGRPPSCSGPEGSRCSPHRRPWTPISSWRTRRRPSGST